MLLYILYYYIFCKMNKKIFFALFFKISKKSSILGISKFRREGPTLVVESCLGGQNTQIFVGLCNYSRPVRKLIIIYC